MRIINEITEYSANMNIILTHNKLKDNIDDDKRIKDHILYYIHNNVYKKTDNILKRLCKQVLDTCFRGYDYLVDAFGIDSEYENEDNRLGEIRKQITNKPLC